MDEAFSHRTRQARRAHSSMTNLQYHSMAPLTTKLPLADPDELPDLPPYSRSYLEGKSAPTTPRLLSRTPPSLSRSNSAYGASLPKSKSASHLAGQASFARSRKAVSGTATPVSARRRREESIRLSAIKGAEDRDWLLRAAAVISTETREYKGQNWLVSRASSTSLSGIRDAEEDDEDAPREAELLSRHPSRRGSFPHADDDRSVRASRHQSRSHSRVASRSKLSMADSSEDLVSVGDEDFSQGPDFVNLDERLEALVRDSSLDDEATIRRLVRRGGNGGDSWVSTLLGWSLFSVEENDEESSEDEDDDCDVEEELERETLRRNSSRSNLQGITSPPEEVVPPPAPNEGGWNDAAWLLTVASKVLL